MSSKSTELHGLLGLEYFQMQQGLKKLRPITLLWIGCLNHDVTQWVVVESIHGLVEYRYEGTENYS